MKTILAIFASLAVATAVAQTPMTDAVVRTVDIPAGKITLKHGEIVNLGMMPMTMVFDVKEPAMLQKVKPGDNVRFTAEKRGDAYVVTRIEPAAKK